MKYVFKKPLYTAIMLLFDTLGGIIFFPARLFKKRAPNEPRSILVTRLDHIGDFVCTTPLLKNLKRRFPQAKITVLINSASKELVYRDPTIDKVIAYSPQHLARGETSSGFKGLLRVIKDVKNIGFDLGIDPRGDILSIAIMWFGLVKYRVGYGITGGGFLLNSEGRYNKSIHVIDRNLALLELLDVPVIDRMPEVHYDEKDVEAVEGLLEGLDKGLEGVKRGDKGLEGKKGIVLHPFAGAPAREWSRSGFKSLIDGLKDDGVNVFLVGTKNNIGIFGGAIDLRGRLSLPQLAYLIKRTGYFVGLNSGPANIAAALKVPSVVISSGTDIVENWIPDSGTVKFIYKDIGCRPCERKVCPKEKHECMESISVDDVMKEIASALRASQ